MVAMLAMTCLNEDERDILFPRWAGVEAGATLSDDFRIMWEPETRGKPRQLVHRCHVDSDESRDHGCVTRALDHAEGSVAFIRDWQKDPTGYTEDAFLENLGMFLGILCHHVADLCTPVHVGGSIDPVQLGFKDTGALHRAVESAMGRLLKVSQLRLAAVRKIKLSRRFFWNIAKDTHTRWYLRLGEIYPSKNLGLLKAMTDDSLSRAVILTRDLWHTVLRESGMLGRKWSLQPLL